MAVKYEEEEKPKKRRGLFSFLKNEEAEEDEYEDEE